MNTTNQIKTAMVIKVITKTGLQLGHVTKDPTGYRFLPATCAHKPSRKGWPKPSQCIPAWARKMGGRMAVTLALRA